MISALVMASWLSITATRPIDANDIDQPYVFAPPTARDIEMLQTFLTNDDRRIRSESAWALGDSRLAEMNSVLARRLARETNEWVRADLLHAMGRLKDSHDPFAVVTALDDADPDVRRWSVWTLGEWKATATASSVAKRAAKDDSEPVRVEAADMLGKLDTPQAEAALAAMLKDQSPRARQAAARALGNFRNHSGDGLKALLDALKDSDPLVRAAAVASLGMATNVTVDGPVAEMGSDDFPFVRKEVAAALRMLAATNRVQTTIRLLTDPDMSVRMEAAATLGTFHNGDAIHPLVVNLDDKDKFVRHASAKALVDMKMPDEIVPQLILQLDNASTAVRRETAWALGEYGDRRATLPLVKTVTDPDVELSIHSIRALGKIADPSAVEPLIAQLGNRIPEKRSMAALALGQIGDARAVQPLIPILADPEYEPRLRAVIAAGKIKGNLFIKPLIAVLNNVTTEHFSVRAAAAWSLGQIGDASAVPRLEQLIIAKVVNSSSGLTYDDDTVRMNCAVAITRIAREPSNSGQLPVITMFMEDHFAKPEGFSDHLNECFAECLHALTGKDYEFNGHKPLPKQFFVHSVEGKE